MTTEALEGIVGNTNIDIYPLGTAALYWGPSREEEEMFMMEEEMRREANRLEINNAIRAEYSSAPQPSQWSLDQPDYRVETTYSVDSNIEIIEQPEWHENGCSFTTYVEPEPPMMAGGFGLTYEPLEEPTIIVNETRFMVGEEDYSHMLKCLPEQEFTPQFFGSGCTWEFKIEDDPGMRQFDLLRRVGPLSKLNAGFDPLQSYLEDTHYSQSEKPYTPIINPAWERDLMPEPDPVDYTSSVTDIMNRIGLPELDLKPKSYLPSSLGYLQGMDFLNDAEPDPSFRSPSLILAEMQYKAKKSVDSLFSSVGKPSYDFTTDLDSGPLSHLPLLKHQFGMHLIPEPEPDDMPSVMEIMKVTVPKFDFSEYMNPVPDPEPDIPVRPLSSFMEDVNPTVQEMLDSLQSSVGKTSYGKIEDLKLKHVLSAYTPPEPIDTNSFESFGNYINGLGLIEVEDGMGIRERFDFGGHPDGRSGPHIQYDPTKDGKLATTFPRALGGSTHRIDIGQQKDYDFKVGGEGASRYFKYLNKEGD